MKDKSGSDPWGGLWTKEKLRCLDKYLQAYTTALKNQHFESWYIDAFSGSGSLKLRSGAVGGDEYHREYAEGSPLVALRVQNPGFAKVFCVEKKSAHLCELERKIRKEGLWRDGVEMIHGDANEEVPKICNKMQRNTRAVVFLDPFAMELKWETIECLAKTGKVDTWVLFPFMAVSRVAKRRVRSLESLPEWAQKLLNDVYGSDCWRAAYEPIYPLFCDQWFQRSPESLPRIFVERLKEVFEGGVLEEPLELRDKGRLLFHLCFAVGNENGAQLALRIAKFIVDTSQSR